MVPLAFMIDTGNDLLDVVIGVFLLVFFGILIYKIAMEWRANQLLTLRAGYSYNSAPFKSTDADLTVMHLGLVQHHITGGAKFAVSEKMDLELSAMYAPKASLSGPELMNPAPGRTMTTDASQFEVTVGAVYRFGDTPRNNVPLK